MTRVHSTKFDGSKHYRFVTTCVAETQDEIRVYSPPGTALDSYRGQLTSSSHNLRLYWPDRHWNLSVRWRPDWKLEDYYVNVATPATWAREQIDWVDLDLDVIHSPGAEEPLIDDEDEFERHSILWHYPADLVARCHTTVQDVRRLMKDKRWPFDGSLEGWRPMGAR